MTRLSELALDRATVVVKVPGTDSEVKIVYRAQACTLEARELFFGGTMQQGLEWLCGVPEVRDEEEKIIREGQEAVLIEWDVTNDDDTPYPITPDAMKKLPEKFVFAVGIALFNGQAPGESKPDA